MPSGRNAISAVANVESMDRGTQPLAQTGNGSGRKSALERIEALELEQSDAMADLRATIVSLEEKVALLQRDQKTDRAVIGQLIRKVKVLEKQNPEDERHKRKRLSAELFDVENSVKRIRRELEQGVPSAELVESRKEATSSSLFRRSALHETIDDERNHPETSRGSTIGSLLNRSKAPTKGNPFIPPSRNDLEEVSDSRISEMPGPSNSSGAAGEKSKRILVASDRMVDGSDSTIRGLQQPIEEPTIRPSIGQKATGSTSGQSKRQTESRFFGQRNLMKNPIVRINSSPSAAIGPTPGPSNSGGASAEKLTLARLLGEEHNYSRNLHRMSRHRSKSATPFGTRIGTMPGASSSSGAAGQRSKRSTSASGRRNSRIPNPRPSHNPIVTLFPMHPLRLVPDDEWLQIAEHCEKCAVYGNNVGLQTLLNPNGVQFLPQIVDKIPANSRYLWWAERKDDNEFTINDWNHFSLERKLWYGDRRDALVKEAKVQMAKGWIIVR